MQEKPKNSEKQKLFNPLDLLIKYFYVFISRFESPKKIISIKIPDSYETTDLSSYNIVNQSNYKDIGLSIEIAPAEVAKKRSVRIIFTNTDKDKTLRITLFPNEKNKFTELSSTINFIDIPPRDTISHLEPLSSVKLNQGNLEIKVEYV